MKKQILFYTLSCAALSTANRATLEAIKNRPAGQPIVFVFDIHGVIARFSKKKAIKESLKHGNKIKFIGKTVIPYVWQKLTKKRTQQQSIEAYASEKDTKLLNPHILDDEMLAYIVELRKQGHHMYICSNIGERSFKTMQIAEALDRKSQLVGGPTPVLTDKIIATKATGYRKKSNPQIYRDLVEKIKNNQQDPFIIFVDDESGNLRIAQAATQQGTPIHGYKFTNVHCLKTDLQAVL